MGSGCSHCTHVNFTLGGGNCSHCTHVDFTSSWGGGDLTAVTADQLHCSPSSSSDPGVGWGGVPIAVTADQLHYTPSSTLHQVGSDCSHCTPSSTSNWGGGLTAVTAVKLDCSQIPQKISLFSQTSLY